MWPPTDSEAREPEVADPPDRVTGPPKLKPSITNCTVPSGVPAPVPAAETWAVNWTAWPKAEGFWDDETAVEESDFPTTWPTGVSDPTLALKLASPR